MWRRTVLGTCAALVLAACATTSPQTASTAAAKTPVGCVSDTATRLPVKPGDCAGFGSTYTQQDLDRTGQVYVQDALHLLDPSITVH